MPIFFLKLKKERLEVKKRKKQKKKLKIKKRLNMVLQCWMVINKKLEIFELNHQDFLEDEVFLLNYLRKLPEPSFKLFSNWVLGQKTLGLDNS